MKQKFHLASHVTPRHDTTCKTCQACRAVLVATWKTTKKQ